MSSTDHRIRALLDPLWRSESPRIIASLARLLRNLDRAEELAQDAWLAAIEQWPREGLPEQPAAWLMTTARRKAIDQLRRAMRMQDIRTELENTAQQIIDEAQRAELDERLLEDDFGDDLLRLLFTACHPLLPPESRSALTLKLLGGLTTAEIARAFLQTEATIAQRIVRAKRTLADAGVAFEVPRGSERGARLASVLEVIYLIYNEGYAATAGDDWMRPNLCTEALRLGQVLATLAAGETEVLGLLALMQIQSSRTAARHGPDGEPVLLLAQDRSRWDAGMIAVGLTLLDQGLALSARPGPYLLQAAIAACHARATSAEQTPWQQIVTLYDALLQWSPSPVVALNRAVAVSMAQGAQAGLDAVDALLTQSALRHYHLLPSVRGEMLLRLGRKQEAAAEFSRAAQLTQNRREREFLLGRARVCGIPD